VSTGLVSANHRLTNHGLKCVYVVSASSGSCSFGGTDRTPFLLPRNSSDMSNGLLDNGRAVPELLEIPIQLHILANGVVAKTGLART
jgi:hypothetical protein